ncbi:MAG TPA: formate dehydrogenase accessory sulfurtransferase FdhD [Candidatus Acidoferrales bacterium]|nr:formate dehydrogenase accessory sulfurtransferase FdhD [Candidatus Acidoferrales bacterium]
MPTPPRSVDLTLVQEWQDGRVRPFQDYLAGEEPLEIRAGGASVSVTMRTPGSDLELAAGFLLTEGLIQRREQILHIAPATACKPTEQGNVVEVGLEPDALAGLDRLRRNFYATSSCGICGKASIDSVRLRGIPPPNPGFRIGAETLCRLPDSLREGQAIFGRTGGLHSAALFSAQGHLEAQREDIGRHNAVDKIVGWALLAGRLPLSQSLLMVSGRGGFEIIQKAAAAGIPLVACVSAPSSLAVRLARELRMTLVGFLRGRRFVIYSGEERIQMESAPPGAEPH